VGLSRCCCCNNNIIIIIIPKQKIITTSAVHDAVSLVHGSSFPSRRIQKSADPHNIPASKRYYTQTRNQVCGLRILAAFCAYLKPLFPFSAYSYTKSINSYVFPYNMRFVFDMRVIIIYVLLLLLLQVFDCFRYYIMFFFLLVTAFPPPFQHGTYLRKK